MRAAGIDVTVVNACMGPSDSDRPHPLLEVKGSSSQMACLLLPPHTFCRTRSLSARPAFSQRTGMQRHQTSSPVQPQRCSPAPSPPLPLSGPAGCPARRGAQRPWACHHAAHAGHQRRPVQGGPDTPRRAARALLWLPGGQASGRQAPARSRAGLGAVSHDALRLMLPHSPLSPTRSEPPICLSGSLNVDDCSTGGDQCWRGGDGGRLSACVDTFRGYICSCPPGGERSKGVGAVVCCICVGGIGMCVRACGGGGESCACCR